MKRTPLIAVLLLAAAAASFASSQGIASARSGQTRAASPALQSDNVADVPINDLQENAIRQIAAEASGVPIDSIEVRFTHVGEVEGPKGSQVQPSSFDALVGPREDIDAKPPTNATVVSAIVTQVGIQVQLVPPGDGAVTARTASIDKDGRATDLGSTPADRTIQYFSKDAGGAEPPPLSTTTGQTSATGPHSSKTIRFASNMTPSMRRGLSRGAPSAVPGQAIGGYCLTTLYGPQLIYPAPPLWSDFWILAKATVECSEAAFVASSLNLLIDTVVTEHRSKNDWTGGANFFVNSLPETCVISYPGAFTFYDTVSNVIQPVTGPTLYQSRISGPTPLPCWASPF